MAFLSIPVNNCCRPLSRTLRLSDAIDEMLGLAFQPVGYHYPRYLCLSPTQSDKNKQLCKEKQDHVKVAELNVRKYKPDEVECKVEDGKVLVSGKQRIETEHGYETSEFHRAYNLPESVDPESVKSRIEDGVLHVEGKKQQTAEEAGKEDDKKLSLKINLGSYKPEEVNVKIQDNGLVVSAEHKTEQDGAYTYRHFKQYFTLPDQVDVNTFVSKFSQDGILRIEADRKPTPAIEDKEIKIEREEDKNQELAELENTEE